MQHCNTKCDTKIFVIFKNSNILYIISNIRLFRCQEKHRAIAFFLQKKLAILKRNFRVP